MTSKRTQHLVVDGSNIATEGRTTPSLVQLDEAVRAVANEGFDPITVIVDATFPRRIEAGELDDFEARTLDGTIVTPPAGVVGRGDAFILQVAAQVDAVVLSNDSFQEFHGEHEWLLTEDQRLLGGKPVPNVGWVFAWRGPVRGAKSRQSIKAAKTKAAETPAPEGQPLPEQAKRPSRKAARRKPADTAKRSTQTRQSKQSKQSEESTPKSKVNEPHHLNDVNEFMAFVTKYSIGDTIEGHVERYSSHGCYLRAATAQCYLPIKAMGDPPPTKARDLLSKGDLVRARVESLDAHRRGINVSLVSVTPQADNNDQKHASNPPRRSVNNMATTKKTAKKRTTKKAAPKKAVKKAAPKKAVKRTTKKAAPKKAAPKKAVKRTTKKAAPKKAVKRTTKKAAPKKAAPKKAAPKKAVKRTTKKAAPKKAVKRTTKKATPKKAAPKKAVKRTTKKAAPKKAAPKKAAPKKAAPKKAVKRTRKR